MPLVPAPCCILVCLVGLTTMELVTFMDGVQKWAWYLGGASFVALRLTSLLLTSHNSDSQSVNKPSYFFCSQICIFLQKKKCRDALNKLCTYYCYGPPPPGGAGAGDLSTTLIAECFWGGDWGFEFALCTCKLRVLPCAANGRSTSTWKSSNSTLTQTISGSFRDLARATPI